MTSPTNSDVTSFFVVTDLTPITDKPTRASLRAIQTELNTNAMSVPTNESTLGHLSLTMDATAYLQKATKAFPVPPNPGSGPTIARAASDAAIKQAHFEYKTKKAEYDIYIATDRALKTQLIKAVPDMFFNILKDDDIGYASVTILQILTHLWDTYGTIDDDQLAANIARMNTPWSPPTPIDTLFTQLTIGKKFAAEAEPISEASAIRTGVGIIEQNGLFPISCREWRGKTADNKKWTHFVEHFRLAEKEFNRSATTENAGYHTANAAVNPPNLEDAPDIDNVPFVTTPHAFAAAVAEAAAVTAPTPPPTPPAPAFDPATFAAAVVAAVAAANPDNGRGRRGRRDRRPPIPAGYGYCWTHGHVPQIGENPHGSATCRNRRTGHREDATADNRMGGNNTVYQRR